MSIKKLIVLMLVIFSFATPVLGAEYTEANGIILNGQEISLDVKPIIVDGRTMVPVRFILEELGMKVAWDGDNKVVIGEKEDNVLKITLEEGLATDGTYNGVPFYSENAPNIIVNSRTLVPVRTIATLLELDVAWEQDKKNVILEETTKPQVSLKEAYGKLVNDYNYIETDQDLEFAYLPFGGYASRNTSFLDDNYIFAVNSYYWELQDDGSFAKKYNTWDTNICVNKYTGKRSGYEALLGVEGTIPYNVKDYIVNHQHHLSNAEAFWWDETHLENLTDETINSLYDDFLKEGGNKYIIRDFAEYLSVNAPIYPNWKAVFESSFVPDYEQNIVRYEYYGDGMYGVYIEGRDTPVVYVNARTGYYRG